MDDLFDEDWSFRGSLSGRLAARHKPQSRSSTSTSNNGGRRRGGRGKMTRPSASSQRAVVVQSITRLGGGGAAKDPAHASYLQRDGTGPDGERADAFDKDQDAADLDAFVERTKDDRHQFRWIVSPEQGDELHMREYVRDYMERVSNDLETDLDWAAVCHDNTDQPHAHIIVRGVRDDGQDLVIDPEYLRHGLRNRARDVATQHLGPRTHEHARSNLERQRKADHWTSIDRQLVRSQGDNGRVCPSQAVADQRDHDDFRVHDLRERLAYLERHGLAERHAKNEWSVDEDLKACLEERSRQRDIIRRMQGAGASTPDRWDLDEAVPDHGRVLDRGLDSDRGDAHYLVVDGDDGRLHHLTVEASHDARVGDNVSMRSAKGRAEIEVLESLASVQNAQGPTWVDRTLSDNTPSTSSGRFARELNETREARRQSLVARGIMDADAPPPPDLIKRLRAAERRDFGVRYAADHDLEVRPLREGDRLEGELSDAQELRGGPVHVLETDDGACVVVPSNRYLREHEQERVSITRTRGDDGRLRNYVDPIKRNNEQELDR